MNLHGDAIIWQIAILLIVVAVVEAAIKFIPLNGRSAVVARLVETVVAIIVFAKILMAVL